MNRKTLGAAGTALALLASPVLAHHTADAIDLERRIELSGTVKQFAWTNPITTLSLVGAPAKGKPQEWLLDLSSPGSLARKGVTKTSLRPGDRISVTIHPLKDGQPGGRVISLVLPNGTVVEQ